MERVIRDMVKEQRSFRCALVEKVAEIERLLSSNVELEKGRGKGVLKRHRRQARHDKTTGLNPWQR